jgi:hypothetical protein
MENKSNVVLYYSLGAIVIIVLVVLWAMNRSVLSTSNVNQAVNQTSQTTTPISTEDTSTGSIHAATNEASLSYAQALITYANERIQFDETCQALPNTVTYKDNTAIMLDNRSPQPRTIKIGVDFTVKAYGFKIIILPNVYLTSKTLYVDCDASQNVATILVQE